MSPYADHVHDQALALRDQWDREEYADRAIARAREVAETRAALDEADLDAGRAPRPDNPAVAEQLTDRAEAQRTERARP